MFSGRTSVVSKVTATVGFNGDGRTDRASLQPLHVSSFGVGRTAREICGVEMLGCLLLSALVFVTLDDFTEV